MKKIIFTAIAMIAFSSASMANTIADEEVENKKAVVTDCCSIYDLAYTLAIREGASPANADTAANIAYNGCKASKAKKSISAG